MMSTLFVREHKAIVGALKATYPQWTDEELYQRGRLVTAALIAKIHTVEWTPASLAHPTAITGLRANWWGLAGERIHRLFGQISSSEVISGIPRSEQEHYGVPYSLTEEFTIVYRMHPLIPDDYQFRSAGTDEEICWKGMQELSGLAAQTFTREVDMTDIFYSFGTAHPGAIVLHNFPTSLMQFQRPDNDRL